MLVAGIDIGSLSAEAVILADKRIAGYSILPVGAEGRRAAEEALAAALATAGIPRGELAAIVATGYGRIVVPFADRRVTEITCHARGAVYLLPDTRTVIDIGGQDSKVIRVNARGEVEDFAMNDKCAAGTGRFLEVMARALETDLEGLSLLAEAAGKAAPITSICAVFAESEVVSLIGQGTLREEIALGLCESIAERVAALVHRVGVVEKVAMTGGVAKNRAVVAALTRRLGVPVVVPPEPQIVGALGAALIARDLVRQAKR
ncbi:acyl-CoA dehydratase activase [Thermodesulfitimonas autotrophica]|uniref:acyl-CoA dehydratase activase n=1 Tax=Thermodesulfitimonas autotrophica TaxID=1894989 RepID=UPI002FE306B7